MQVPPSSQQQQQQQQKENSNSPGHKYPSWSKISTTKRRQLQSSSSSCSPLLSSSSSSMNEENNERNDMVTTLSYREASTLRGVVPAPQKIPSSRPSLVNDRPSPTGPSTSSMTHSTVALPPWWWAQQSYYVPYVYDSSHCQYYSLPPPIPAPLCRLNNNHHNHQQPSPLQRLPGAALAATSASTTLSFPSFNNNCPSLNTPYHPIGGGFSYPKELASTTSTTPKEVCPEDGDESTFVKQHGTQKDNIRSSSSATTASSNNRYRFLPINDPGDICSSPREDSITGTTDSRWSNNTSGYCEYLPTIERIGPPSLKIYKGRLPLSCLPLLEQIVFGCEEYAQTLPRGWKTDLYSLTQQDLACQDVPGMMQLVRPITAFISQQICDLFHSKSIQVDQNQPHVLKYSIQPNHQTGVQLHHDRCDVTANIMLSRSSTYVGGGTFLPDAHQVVRLAFGEFLLHPGELVHGGMDITSGVRYLMVMFVNLAA